MIPAPVVSHLSSNQTASSMPYLVPRNSNASGLSEITRRVAGLLRCLTTEINSSVASGALVDDLQRFAQSVRDRLEKDGWTFSYDGGSRFKARPPGDPRPFPKRSSSKNATRREP